MVTMTSTDLLPATVLKRKAVVYVRQSSQSQVQNNLESQRWQYDLVEEARSRGFRDVEVIDDDLGRSASGMVARPGFDRLVAWLCAGEIGAVLCFDASRLARNGRDWHHLLELCGLVDARVIDLDGVYDPYRPNDRLLLGMKGSISEFELGIIRTRMLDAARAKARRGELRISVPTGYIWHREMGLDFKKPSVSLRAIPQAGRCATSPAFDDSRSNPFPAAVGRQAADHLRLDPDSLSQCDFGVEEPVLCRGLCLRHKRPGSFSARVLSGANEVGPVEEHIPSKPRHSVWSTEFNARLK
jgi:DNA invertase Pin-like site-specific DNA recombinase